MNVLGNDLPADGAMRRANDPARQRQTNNPAYREPVQSQILNEQDDIQVNDFVVRHCDVLAVKTIDAWIAAATDAGVHPEKIASAMIHRDEIFDWQSRHGAKLPD